MRDRRIDEALRHIHPPPGAKPWHGGPTVLGALRGVSPEVASWRPYPDRHSIWDLALHVAYWNYAVERRLTDAPRGGFPRQPSNWPNPTRGEPDQAWAEDKRLLKRQHDSLLEALASFETSRLDEVAEGKGSTTYADLITGVLLHDTYHAGQIQMLKRLARSHGV
ncbi:DinB family protein [Gemmatimonadota bacterium]